MTSSIAGQRKRSSLAPFLCPAQENGWQSSREAAGQEQRETLRRENIQLRTTLATAEGHQEALANEIGQLRAMLQQVEARYVEGVRDAEILRSELKTAQADQKRLQQELVIQTAALPDQSPTAESDSH